MTPESLQLVGLLLVVGCGVLGICRFEYLCLTDLAETPDYQLRVLNRPAWAAFILLCIPLGGVAYLLYGRPR